MGRQIQLHVLPKDVNELLAATHGREPLEIAMRIGNSATPERLAFLPENVSGKTLVLWSNRFAPQLQRRYVAKAEPPYYVVDEQTELALELSLSGLTTWQGRPALTQGRIYGVFENKQAEFEKCYERIARYIRRHWRKNPALWMGGYIGQPQATGSREADYCFPTIFHPFTAIGFNVLASSTRIDCR